MHAVDTLLTDAGFRTGLVLGLVAAVGVALAATFGRQALPEAARRRALAWVSGRRALPSTANQPMVSAAGRRMLPWVGVAFGFAAAVGFTHRFGVGADFVLGLLAVGAAGLVAAHRQPAVRMLVTLPGAAVFAQSTELSDAAWAAPTIAAVTVVGGTLAAELDRSVARSGLGPVLVVVTLLGVYATTPDNGHSRLLLGIALPLALLGWPRPLASLGAAGAPLVVGLVSWTVVVDGAPRPGSVVGGLACLGIFVIEPTIRWLRHQPPSSSVALILAVHIGVVGVSSRVAGLRTPVSEALVISTAVYAVAAIVLFGLASRRPAPILP